MLRGAWRSMGVVRSVVLVVLVIVAVGSSLLSAAQSPSGADDEWWSGWLQNFSTEMMGAIVTFALFELIVGTIEQREAKREREAEHKARLLREIRSGVPDLVKTTIHEIREHGWLEGEDGLLKGAKLGPANLQGATLWKSNLQGAYLLGADLQGATLEEANLQGATLYSANLQGAGLLGANLQRANLLVADLQGADLRDANLQRANLRHAELKDANLYNAIFDENTTLPDETKWSPDITQEEMTVRFGCVFISLDGDYTEYAAWKARHEQYAAGMVED